MMRVRLTVIDPPPDPATSRLPTGRFAHREDSAHPREAQGPMAAGGRPGDPGDRVMSPSPGPRGYAGAAAVSRSLRGAGRVSRSSVTTSTPRLAAHAGQ